MVVQCLLHSKHPLPWGFLNCFRPLLTCTQAGAGRPPPRSAVCQLVLCLSCVREHVEGLTLSLVPFPSAPRNSMLSWVVYFQASLSECQYFPHFPRRGPHLREFCHGTFAMTYVISHFPWKLLFNSNTFILSGKVYHYPKQQTHVNWH